jgi:hypothetical protein
MFEKTERPKRVGNKLIFKFNSTEEILAFQEAVGIGMFIYASRNKPEFKTLLKSIDSSDEGLRQLFMELQKNE